MRRVLFVTQSTVPVGGTHRVLELLAAGLTSHGWEVLVAVADSPGGRDFSRYRDLHPDLECVRVDGGSGTWEGRTLGVTRVLRRTAADVAIPVTLADPLEAVRRLKAEGRGPRLVFGLHETSPHILCDVRAYATVIDRGIGVSRLTAELLRAVGGLSDERVDCVRSGIELGQTAEPREPGAPLRIGYVGRLEQGHKRVLDLPEVLARLASEGCPFTCRVAGAGPEEGRLRQRLAELGLDDRVRFDGWLDMEALYREVYPQLDVLLHFSTWEGLGHVPLEAQAHGVVPVVSDFIGRSWEGVLKDGETAMVFPIGDVTGAARAVLALSKDEELRGHLAIRARAAVESEHAIPSMVSGWARCLDAALDGPPAGLGSAPPAPSRRPSGRLSRWLPDRPAEWVRRVLSSPDSPRFWGWPFCFDWSDRDVTATWTRIEEIAVRGPGASGRGS